MIVFERKISNFATVTIKSFDYENFNYYLVFPVYSKSK